MTTAAAEPADHPAERVAVALARRLRSEGLRAPTDATITFARALGLVGVEHRERAYWAARATLVSHPDDIATFDRCFASFWDRLRVDGATMASAPGPDLGVTPSADGAQASSASGGDVTPGAGDGSGGLRRPDLATYDPHERAHADSLMRQLRDAGAPRASPRRRPARRGSRPDRRATIRAALRTGGEPIRRPTNDVTRRARRIVLLLDVSGSMEPYARQLLRFVHAAVAGRRHVEAFAMGTTLTHVTRELDVRDPDHAIVRAGARVTDWNGGTRLGTCLRSFNDRWGIRGMARGSIVVVLSDGWDRGDLHVLGEQLRRLRRVAHSLIWVNPVPTTPGYVPLARGLAVAIPLVDHLVDGHSIAALDELIDIIGDRRVGGGRARAAG